MDIFNLNNVLTTKRKEKIKDLINKKIEDPQFKPNRSDVKSIVTDIDHKLYTQYYRQTHMSNDPILFNRQSGYMPLTDKEYTPHVNQPEAMNCCKSDKDDTCVTKDLDWYSQKIQPSLQPIASTSISYHSPYTPSSDSDKPLSLM